MDKVCNPHAIIMDAKPYIAIASRSSRGIVTEHNIGTLNNTNIQVVSQSWQLLCCIAASVNAMQCIVWC